MRAAKSILLMIVFTIPFLFADLYTKYLAHTELPNEGDQMVLVEGDAFRLPQVQGLIHSLVGPEPRYDHHAAHLVQAGNTRGPDMHQDSVIDFRENYFDIQLSVFPADTPDEMGGTFLVPGTHFRYVRTGEIHIYQHMRGKIWASCPAGTVYVWNTRVWHGSRSNHTVNKNISQS